MALDYAPFCKTLTGQIAHPCVRVIVGLWAALCVQNEYRTHELIALSHQTKSVETPCINFSETTADASREKSIPCCHNIVPARRHRNLRKPA